MIIEKKSMLYILNINWNWIKQRPQFLAEELSKDFNIKVIYPFEYSLNKQLVTDDLKIGTNKISIKSFFRFPLDSKSKSIKIINDIILSLYLKYSKSSIIWITSPKLYRFNIKKNHHFLVYDCMDDMLEFSSNVSLNNEIKKREEQLINDADLVICSSDYLKSKLELRYKTDKVINVINNAISFSDFEETITLPPENETIFTKHKLFSFTYIGTISEWMNFNLLISALNRFDNIEFLLFGPLHTSLPKHERLRYCGLINHKYIYKTMEMSSALIMPFYLSELILSVNPVKAYEYIFAYKPILAPLYPEMLKFKDYIYLYKNEDDFLDCINSVINKHYYFNRTKEEFIQFATDNTWSRRAEKIAELINKCNNKV